jgi:hypothetical protein
MFCNSGLLLLSAVLLIATVSGSQVLFSEENGVKTAVYHSPKFLLEAGSVSNKYYYNIDFPRGHIAMKGFTAEVVDELGNPVPLHETYLHHWALFRYYALTDENGDKELKTISLRNSGICQDLGQYYGIGSETRRTDTDVPDPYGIEIGNEADIPDGYMERWYLNVHAIDTRGAVDKLGCTECRCNLYNITKDVFNRPLTADYPGGLLCCYDQTQCKIKEGFQSIRRSLYLRYTVKWADWVDSIIPVKIYILDVTDTGERVAETSKGSIGLSVAQHGCMTEYSVKSCGVSGESGNGCLDNKRTSIVMPVGGYVVYGVGHQHTGAIGTTIYGGDGRKICSSMAIYGEGKEAGNEKGYVVGMTTCYPKPGSVKISKGETVVFESNYSSSQMHTGVMGLFYFLIADQQPKDLLQITDVNEHTVFPKYSWALVFVGAAIALAVIISYGRKNEREEGYQSLVV